jgi:hypothetical protein
VGVQHLYCTGGGVRITDLDVTGDGSFSGNLDTEVGGSNRLFNLGSDADIAAGDTEYLETSFDTNVATIATKKTGAGATRSLLLDVDNQMQMKIDAGIIYFRYAGLNKFFIETTAFKPWGSGKSLGGTTDRFAGIYGVDGSFTGNLNSEVGGSIRHYSTGTEGDTDTSFIEIGDDGTRHTIYTTRTGAGSARNLRVGNSSHYMEVIPTDAKMDWYISGVKLGS